MTYIEGYEVTVCSCPSAYIGARKAGSIDTCHTCGFVTPEHWSYILERYVKRDDEH